MSNLSIALPVCFFIFMRLSIERYAVEDAIMDVWVNGRRSYPEDDKTIQGKIYNSELKRQIKAFYDNSARSLFMAAAEVAYKGKEIPGLAYPPEYPESAGIRAGFIIGRTSSPS